MECQSCGIVEKGKLFQVCTQSSSDAEALRKSMEDIMRQTGDEWVDLLSKKYGR